VFAALIADPAKRGSVCFPMPPMTHDFVNLLARRMARA
jgi:hypothetical protein